MKFSIIAGCICHLISGMVGLYAVLQLCLMIYCIAMIMYETAHPTTVDHYWNCGVLICGVEFPIAGGIAFLIFRAGKVLLRGKRPKLPIWLIGAAIAFLVFISGLRIEKAHDDEEIHRADLPMKSLRGLSRNQCLWRPPNIVKPIVVA